MINEFKQITNQCESLASSQFTLGYYNWNNWQWVPNYSYPYTPVTYIQQTEPAQDFMVRKVTNGFIVTRKGSEYVFETSEKLAKFMIKEIGEK